MNRRVSVMRTIEAPAPPAQVLEAVHDVKNIEYCEVKADAVEVVPDSGTSGWYAVRGRFAGLPWRGRFTYALHSTGFHSHNAARHGKQPTIEGGFRVEPLDRGRCVVAHYEEYVLVPWLLPLRGAIRRYLRWSMDRELRDLATLSADRRVRARVAGGSTPPSMRVRAARLAPGRVPARLRPAPGRSTG